MSWVCPPARREKMPESEVRSSKESVVEVRPATTERRPPSTESDIFVIEEIDVVPAECLTTMRC